MATYTSHYQLHQWEASDSFLRTDFNTDFQKIDAALGEKAEAEETQAELDKKAQMGSAAVQPLTQGRCTPCRW